MAMLTQRVFLLEMTYPLNLLEYISPNAVQWDSSIVPHSIVTHDLYSPSRIKKYWPAFVNDLLTDGGAEMIEFRSNEGFTYFYPEMVKSPHILQLFMSLGADNRSNYAGLYGCTVKFLFNLRPVTTWAAVSQLRNLGLVAGKYVAVHIRTSLSSLEGDLRHADPTEWNKFLQCAVRTSNYLAKKLRLKSVPIFLAADEDVVKEYAVNNFGNRVVLSQVNINLYVTEMCSKLINVCIIFVYASRLMVVSRKAKEEVPCDGLSTKAREYFTRINLVKIKKCHN